LSASLFIFSSTQRDANRKINDNFMVSVKGTNCRSVMESTRIWSVRIFGISNAYALNPDFIYLL